MFAYPAHIFLPETIYLNVVVDGYTVVGVTPMLTKNATGVFSSELGN